MKKTNYSIQIDNPCAENWNSMTKTDKGKFCAMCKKNVIDFSKLTDNEILKIIESNNKNLCGRFTQTQLNRVLIDTNPQTSPKLYQFLAGLLLFSVADANAITEKPKIENFEKEIKNPIISENDTLPKAKSQTNLTITGKITDAKKQEIPGATIVLKGNKQVVTVTNDNGEFSLNIPEEILEDFLVFEIYAATFEDRTLMISQKDIESKKFFLVEMKEDENKQTLFTVSATQRIKQEKITLSMGAICIISGSELKRKWWQFWKRRNR